MKLRTWIYFFRHALISIRNNRLVCMISMGTIVISMLLLGSFMLLSVNLNSWIRAWGESMSMSIYLEDNLSGESKGRIKEALLDLEGAEIIGFISKETAMINLQEGLGAQAGLLAGLKENPLPASFEIEFNNVRQYDIAPLKIKNALEEMEGVDEVQYSDQLVEKFEGVIYVFRISGFIIGGLLCVAVLFITTNTVKLTIYSRRDEIKIYKLVGATDWFVRIPFLIEGSIQGLVSGATSFVILFLIFSIFSVKSVHLFGLPVLDIIFLSEMHALFIVSLSTALGFMGGLLAIGQFFDV
jgi:cell division transport system permease protein